MVEKAGCFQPVKRLNYKIVSKVTREFKEDIKRYLLTTDVASSSSGRPSSRLLKTYISEAVVTVQKSGIWPLSGIYRRSSSCTEI